jgi:hypothetical protein
MYFPELVCIIQKSSSSALHILKLTLGMVSDLRMRMIDDGHRQLEAAWQSQETIKEVLSGLECVEITMELIVLDHTRNTVSIKNALQDMEGTVMALRRIFCDQKLRMYG